MRSGKYRTEPPDILEKITELERRLSVLERVPRIGNTSIDTGSLTVKGGDIVIQNAEGIDIIRIFQSGDIGGAPEIRFTPLVMQRHMQIVFMV